MTHSTSDIGGKLSYESVFKKNWLNWSVFFPAPTKQMNNKWKQKLVVGKIQLCVCSYHSCSKRKKNFKATYNIHSMSMGGENAAKTGQIKRTGQKEMKVRRYD